MKTIACLAYKGGVGKTTTALALCELLSQKSRVLAIDLDQRQNHFLAGAKPMKRVTALSMSVDQLADVLQSRKEKYCIIDVPPAADFDFLANVDMALMVIAAQGRGMENLDDCLAELTRVKNEEGVLPETARVLITQVKVQREASVTVRDSLRQRAGNFALKTTIPNGPGVDGAEQKNLSIVAHDPNSIITLAYQKALQEILECLQEL